mgnify:CR=1 FL=1
MHGARDKAAFFIRAFVATSQFFCYYVPNSHKPSRWNLSGHGATRVVAAEEWGAPVLRKVRDSKTVNGAGGLFCFSTMPAHGQPGGFDDYGDRQSSLYGRGPCH